MECPKAQFIGRYRNSCVTLLVPGIYSLTARYVASTIPSKSTTSLFAALATQRQKRVQAEAEATVKVTERSVPSTPEPATAPSRSLLSRKSQRSPPKDEERRSGDGQSRPQPDANVRPRRPSNVVTRPAQANSRTDRRREGSRVTKPNRAVEPAIKRTTLSKSNENLEIEDTATPPVLHTSFNNTDLSELFSSPAPSPHITRPSAVQSHTNTRMQLLKERAGDYSRYLPGEVNPTALTVGSAGYAKLILARKKDIGLKPRHTIVELMRDAGVNDNSTSGM